MPILIKHKSLQILKNSPFGMTKSILYCLTYSLKEIEEYIPQDAR